MIGYVFGKLTVIKINRRMYLCRCVCGKEISEMASRLLSGRRSSCGCRANFTSHGLTKSGAYTSWASMKYRCFNKNCHAYLQYGGSGITVCDRWLKFENFLEDMGPRPKGLTLDRHPSNSKIYSKETCRWASRLKQTQNRGGHRGATSKFKGVFWNKINSRWNMRIFNNGKIVCSKLFKTEAEAALAYNQKAKELWGTDAFQNDLST